MTVYCYCDSKQQSLLPSLYIDGDMLLAITVAVHNYIRTLFYFCVNSLFSLLCISIDRYFMCAQSWNSENSLARDYKYFFYYVH